MTACGDEGRANTSWASASSPTGITSATASATDGDSGTQAAPTEGSAGDAGSEGAGATDPGVGTTTEPGGGAEPPSGDSGPAPGDTLKFDLGDIETTSAGAEGCKRVDFLFVIDNSVSMEGEQAALAAAFPAFIATIEQTLPTSDYHIMVVDTDATWRCSPQSCTHETCQAANKHACMAVADACDTTRGAGVVHPRGAFAANKACDFEPGRRYLPGDDPQLLANFECAAKVGTAGDPKERPMDAMVEAVSGPLRAPGGCNEGFLRDDAILVVTFITDDDKVEDQHTAQQTHAALVAAKGGDADRVVMLGLIPGGGCAEGGLHWAELIGLFGPRGIQGQVCSPDYNAFFQDAVATILDTCVINPG